MNHFLFAPVTDAQRQRDALLGALVGWPAPPSTSRRPRTPTVCWPPVSGWLQTRTLPKTRCAGCTASSRRKSTASPPTAPPAPCAAATPTTTTSPGSGPRRRTSAPSNCGCWQQYSGWHKAARTLAHRRSLIRPFCPRRRLGRGTSRLHREAGRGLLCRVNSQKISAFPRALHFFSLRCAAHKSGQFLFYRAFFPFLSEFSVPGAEIWGCFFQKYFTNVKEITII